MFFGAEGGRISSRVLSVSAKSASTVMVSLILRKMIGAAMRRDSASKIQLEMNSAVERPHNGGFGGLDTLVETDVIGRSATRIGTSTNIPKNISNLNEKYSRERNREKTHQ